MDSLDDATNIPSFFWLNSVIKAGPGDIYWPYLSWCARLRLCQIMAGDTILLAGLCRCGWANNTETQCSFPKHSEPSQAHSAQTSTRPASQTLHPTSPAIPLQPDLARHRPFKKAHSFRSTEIAEKKKKKKKNQFWEVSTGTTNHQPALPPRNT
ncbi:hypothetical protein BT67DRAFT_81673 [Trichocladium antarcticum]|uniref:Uncharacterized protein n=1 Tax=Trichocladium antarcticum TaxID=1450529 RepID=A0AAN6ZCP1_9PEZI|nr:hypothetical protein BT67DRAFT_81673 [Trichocladium antarcticum]